MAKTVDMLPKRSDELYPAWEQYLERDKPPTRALPNVAKVLARFGSLAAFAASDRRDWRAAYRAGHPKGKGLGKNTEARLLVLRSAVKELVESRKKDLDKANAEKRAAEKRAAEAERTLRTRFTASELKALSSMMEVCGFESVDLREIGTFFAAFKLASAGPAAKEANDAGQAKAGN